MPYRPFNPPVIAASLLAADFAAPGREAGRALAAGADWLHLDVMDNQFVPNLTFGPPLCAALRRLRPTAFLDVHLMTENPERLVAPFAAAGASALTFHPETARHPHRLARDIRAAGMKSGVALNPGTPLSVIQHLGPEVDLILVMTVNPGFGGQEFLPEMRGKIEAALMMSWGIPTPLDSLEPPRARVQVDGGINAQTAARCAEWGADTFVAGSALFGAKSLRGAVGEMRRGIRRVYAAKQKAREL